MPVRASTLLLWQPMWFLILVVITIFHRALFLLLQDCPLYPFRMQPCPLGHGDPSWARHLPSPSRSLLFRGLRSVPCKCVVDVNGGPHANFGGFFGHFQPSFELS